jgi:Ca2+-binding RTX toxin-like protein
MKKIAVLGALALAVGVMVAALGLLTNGNVTSADPPSSGCVVNGVVAQGKNVTGTHDGDVIDCSGAVRGVIINGGAGDDTITGSAFDDKIDGGAGEDTIHGGSGDDIVEGGPGSDPHLSGHDGDDVINGGPGDDNLLGGDDTDVCNGGPGNDTDGGGCETFNQ